MVEHINTTFISLLTLSIFIISTTSFLVLRTLQEGRKALHEIKNNTK